MKELWVSNDGSNKGDGSKSQPLKSLQKAVNLCLKDGGRIYVLEGVYRERVKIIGQRQATSIAIQGKGEVVFDYRGVAGNHGIYIQDRSNIRISNIKFINNLKVKDGSFIRVEGTCSNIQILKNSFDTTSGEHAMAVTFYGSTEDGMSDISVCDNHFRNIHPGWSEVLTFNGNISIISVNRNVIEDCGNIAIDFIGGEGMCKNPSKDYVTDATCSYNTIKNAHSPNEGGFAAGIYVDGARNIDIYRNMIENCDLGIEVGVENAAAQAVGVTVSENFVAYCGKSGIIFGGYQLSAGKVERCEFSENTLLMNDQLNTTMGEICIQHASNNVVLNNFIFLSNPFAVRSITADASNALRYNIYYFRISDPVFASKTVKFVWKDSVFKGLSEFQKSTQQENGSSVIEWKGEKTLPTRFTR